MAGNTNDGDEGLVVEAAVTDSSMRHAAPPFALTGVVVIGHAA